MTIAIPAKDEAASIASALEAFLHQRSLADAPLDPSCFEILVFANDCRDGTADVVRAFAARRPEIAVHVFAQTLRGDQAHVGTARRIALDRALERQLAVNGIARGVIASTDADSVVDRYWVARVLDEIARVDAVAGHVEIARPERDAMQAPLRLLYDRECAYRRLLGEIEARYDPRPFDPPARHDSFVGANFAVQCSAYVKAGRLPMLPCLEDRAFARALRRIDARIRHAYDVRVETSGRVFARVEGGFASLLAELSKRGSRREAYYVENARRSVLRATSRGWLRAYWAQRAAGEALDEAARLYGIGASDLASLVDQGAPFGETLDRIDAASIAFETLPDEAIESALATLRDAANAAIAPSATRISAASGAG